MKYIDHHTRRRGTDGGWNTVYIVIDSKEHYFYIGSTWRKGANPVDSGYQTSSTNKKLWSMLNERPDDFTMHVLRYFDTRVESCLFEQRFCTKELVRSPKCLNLAPPSNNGIFGSIESAQNTVKTKRQNNTFSIAAKKAIETMRSTGMLAIRTQHAIETKKRLGISRLAALKTVETMRAKNLYKETIAKGVKTRRERGTDIIGAEKMVKTRKANGSYETGTIKMLQTRELRDTNRVIGEKMRKTRLANGSFKTGAAKGTKTRLNNYIKEHPEIQNSLCLILNTNDNSIFAIKEFFDMLEFTGLRLVRLYYYCKTERQLKKGKHKNLTFKFICYKQ